jgi:hypothetical protein
MVPVVLPTIGVGMVPSAVAGIVTAGDIVAIDAFIEAAPPIVGVGTAAGTVGAVMEGGGRAGTAGGCGAGRVDPGRTDANEVAGCIGNGGLALLVEAGEIDGVADIAGAGEIDGVAPAMTDVETTCAGGVPGVICPVGGAQITTVPGVVGSEASGTGASVVSGEP